MSEDSQLRERLRRHLTEAGVVGVGPIIDDLSDDQLDGAMGAFLWWSDMPHTGGRAVSTGLLVKKIREGGLPGYKRPNDRMAATGSLALTPRLTASLRALMTPLEGGMTREDAETSFEEYATRLNLPLASVVEAAMGPDWRETPPHPAIYQGWGVHYKPADEWGKERYDVFVGMKVERPDLSEGYRRPGESDWAFACRFWRWEDPPELKEVIARIKRQREKEERERIERERLVTVSVTPEEDGPEW